MENKFGLIGKVVGHSYSKNYFDEKFFREERRDYRYDLYPLPEIGDLKKLLADNPEICGLNVTIPYKEQVLPMLDDIDADARQIGAVNVIRVRDGKLKGFNTDSMAFQETLEHWTESVRSCEALVLGTGGSSKAVLRALQKLGIPYQTVSRETGRANFTYDDLRTDKDILVNHKLIINTTPLGMSPDTTSFPDIPYEQLTPEHLVYDLIYNPARTMFLQKAEMRGATIKNGLQMLHLQAEKSWEIWNA